MRPEYTPPSLSTVSALAGPKPSDPGAGRVVTLVPRRSDVLVYQGWAEQAYGVSRHYRDHGHSPGNEMAIAYQRDAAWYSHAARSLMGIEPWNPPTGGLLTR